MRFMEALLQNTPRFSARPKAFGAFHLTSLAIILGLFVLMICLWRYLPRGRVALRRALFVFGGLLLLLEVGKQILYSYQPAVGWDYNWDRFPFQFCSTPIYIALLAACLPDGDRHPRLCSFRHALLCFLGTYSPVAGCAVLFWPSSDVFHEIVFLSVHTMVWHGAMLLFGLYLWLTEAIVPAPKTALAAALVYLPTPFVALGLNELEHALGFAGDDGFNMFYISRFGNCTIPVLHEIQKTAPYPVFFLSYVALLGIGGALVTVGMGLIRFLWSRRRTIQTENDQC